MDPRVFGGVGDVKNVGRFSIFYRRRSQKIEKVGDRQKKVVVYAALSTNNTTHAARPHLAYFR